MRLTTDKSLTASISGGAGVAGLVRSWLVGLLRRSDFPTLRKKPELLPLNAADRAIRRVLTKIIDCRTSSALTQNQIGRVQLISEPRHNTRDAPLQSY